MYNTTMPSKKAFTEYDNYTDDEIKTILNFEFDEEIPCPLDIRLVIIHATRLRHKLATTTDYLSKSTKTIHGFFDTLTEFDIKAWAGNDNPLGEASAQDMGELYRLAAWQYAVLTLPSSATRARAQNDELRRIQTENSKLQDLSQTSRKSELMQKIRTTFVKAEYPVAFKWPLLVAGVAAADGPTEDQAFVEECLQTLLDHPLSDGGLFLCLQRMRDFWESGKTAWEDCFHEPVPAG